MTTDEPTSAEVADRPSRQSPRLPWWPRPRRRSAGRHDWGGGGVLALVVATLLTVTGVGLLGAGVPALWTDQQQRDADGFVTTDERRLRTPTAALVATPLEVVLDRPADELLLRSMLGEVRVHVQSQPGHELFVGLGRADAVQDYLDDVPVDRVRELVASTAVDYERRDGRSRPRPPAAQDLWVESRQGTGALDLDWSVRDGRWALVVMNPDGGPGVEAEVSVGATLPSLTWVASGVVVLGAAFLGAGLVLLVALARPERPRPPAGARRSTGRRPAVPSQRTDPAAAGPARAGTDPRTPT